MVFSTKDRAPVLSTVIRSELHSYLGGVLKNHGCIPIQVGGVEDHVHLLFGLSRTISLAAAAELLKTSSSRWIKSKGLSGFAWQAGYAVFSVGMSETDRVQAYVLNQEEHHLRRSFQDELRALLRESGVEPDERYLWD